MAFSRLTNFRSESRGSTIAMVAFFFMATASAVGATIDYSRFISQRINLQGAVDAAALAQLVTYLDTNDQTGSKSRAEEILYSNVGIDPNDHRLNIEAASIQRSGPNLKSHVKADLAVDSMLLHIVGMNSVDIAVEASAVVPVKSISAVVLADVSWSMRGADLDSLKQAARSFGDAMFNTVPEFRSGLRVGVVPYAGSVNIAPASSRAVDLLRGWEYAARPNRDLHERQKYEDGVGCDATADKHFETLEQSGSNAEFQIVRHRWENVNFQVPVTNAEGDIVMENRSEMRCVDNGEIARIAWSGCIQTEETEFGSFDLLPNGSRPPLPPTRRPDGFPHCPPSSSALRAGFSSGSSFGSYINRMEIGFGTAHDIGMLWAGRWLAPSWNSFFNHDARGWNLSTAPKYIVFLSDGRSSPVGYNFGNYVGRTADSITANANARCSALKELGTTIYGISYGRQDPQAIDIVEACASSSKHVLGSAANLNAVFSKIASEIKTDGVRLVD